MESYPQRTIVTITSTYVKYSGTLTHMAEHNSRLTFSHPGYPPIVGVVG